MKKATLSNAIEALIPNEIFIISLIDGKEVVEYKNPDKAPTEEAIQAKLAELKADYDSKQYQRDRLKEYPSIQELVVALYDEEDKASIIERRKAVKAKYPKPE